MRNRSSKIGLRKIYEADARKQILGRYVTYDRGLDGVYSLLKPALRHKIEERQREVLSEIAKENLNGKMVLDLGCGEGFLSMKLTRKNDKITLVSGDISVNKLKMACRLSKVLNADLNLLVLDAELLPFRSNTFDIIALIETIEHLPRSESCLCEVNRCLKTRGRLYVTIPNRVIERLNRLARGKNLLHIFVPSEKEFELILQHFGFALKYKLGILPYVPTILDFFPERLSRALTSLLSRISRLFNFHMSVFMFARKEHTVL